LFRTFCLACCAAFWRSAKLGSLNPLIDEALLLSWFGVGAIALTQTSAAASDAGKFRWRLVPPRAPGSHQLSA
jgi:hypothetical protein